MHTANQGSTTTSIAQTNERHWSVFGWLVVLVRFRFLMHTAGTTLRVGIKYVDMRKDQNTTQSSDVSTNIIEGILMQSLMIEMVYGALGLLIFSGAYIFTVCNEAQRAHGIATGLKKILGANAKYYLGAHSVSFTASAIGLIAILAGSGLETAFFAVPVMIGLSTLCLGSTFIQDDKVINIKNDNHTITTNTETQQQTNITPNTIGNTFIAELNMESRRQGDIEETLQRNDSNQSLSSVL